MLSLSKIRDFGFSPTFNADEDLLDWMGFLGFRVFVFFRTRLIYKYYKSCAPSNLDETTFQQKGIEKVSLFISEH